MKKYIISLLFVAFSISVINAQYKVIVNAANTQTTISKSELSNYLLKKRTKWPDGTKVVPVDLSSKSKIRAEFTKAIHKKSVSQVRAYWQQSVFSGKATPPREMASDAAVLAFVKKYKGAIGYVSAKANTAGLKEITVK